MPLAIAMLARNRCPSAPLLAVVSIVFSLALSGTPARAQSWNEVGDAGDTPGTAQFTAGNGALNQILGTIPSATDVDMYCIRVTNWASFSACLLCAANADEDIWLFDGSGKGVVAAQLCQGGCKGLSNAFVPGNGLYYLAISAHGLLPYAGSDPI